MSPIFKKLEQIQPLIITTMMNNSFRPFITVILDFEQKIPENTNPNNLYPLIQSICHNHIKIHHTITTTTKTQTCIETIGLPQIEIHITKIWKALQ